MLPSFIVIGAAKCGTTSLCSLLQEHPEVFVTEPKEPHYFTRITNFESTRVWYESLFAGACGHKAAGEGSTSYTHPHYIKLVAPRLATALPHCRFIYMVRHPIRRMESDWTMRTLYGRMDKPISAAVQARVSLLTFGMYWSQLSLYRQFFSDEQILIVFLEDFTRDPKSELHRVYRHIGVDDQFMPSEPAKPRNTSRDRTLSARVDSLQQRVPGIRRIKHVIPARLQHMAKDLILRTARPTPTPEWDEAALREISSLLREDSRQLLAHCGKDADFWEFPSL